MRFEDIRAPENRGEKAAADWFCTEEGDAAGVGGPIFVVAEGKADWEGLSS